MYQGDKQIYCHVAFCAVQLQRSPRQRTMTLKDVRFVVRHIWKQQQANNQRTHVGPSADLVAHRVRGWARACPPLSCWAARLGSRSCARAAPGAAEACSTPGAAGPRPSRTGSASTTAGPLRRQVCAISTSLKTRLSQQSSRTYIRRLLELLGMSFASQNRTPEHKTLNISYHLDKILCHSLQRKTRNF